MGSARIPLTDKIGFADPTGPDSGLTSLSHNFHFHFRFHFISFYYCSIPVPLRILSYKHPNCFCLGLFLITSGTTIHVYPHGQFNSREVGPEFGLPGPRGDLEPMVPSIKFLGEGGV
jgi:hypothetical protein